MTNNDYILDAVKGEPNSLTSIAFNTGVISERARIIKLLEKHDKETRAGNTDMAIKYRAAVLACIALIKGENK